MVNSDSIFNLSNGVTSNWCIKLDAKFMLALSFSSYGRFECEGRTKTKWKHCGPMWYGRDE